MGAYTMDLIRNSTVTPKNPGTTGTGAWRNTDRTPVTPGQFTNRKHVSTRIETPAAAPTAPADAATTQLDALAARMYAGEFTISVADALIALLDVPQNTKKTGESIMMYALTRNTTSPSGNDITYFEVKSFYSRAKGKTVRRIRQLIGAPDDWRRENLPVRMQCLALYHILENQQAAAHLFADTATCCFRCGSPLTNAKSRARRMGDDCAAKS